MKHDQQAILDAERFVYEKLDVGIPDPEGSFQRKDKQGNMQQYKIPPAKGSKITAPAFLIQEAQLVNTVSVYNFQFEANAPGGAASATLNNIQLRENDIFLAFGWQIILGLGALAVTRRYFPIGQSSIDDAFYNGILSLRTETDENVNQISMQHFREEGDINEWAGFIMIQPLRYFMGQTSTITATITFPNSLAGLAFTDDLFISVRPIGGLAQA